MLIAWDVDGTLNTLMQQFASEYGDGERDLAALDELRRRSFREASLSPRDELVLWFAASPVASASVHLAMTATPREFVPELTRWTMASFGTHLCGVLTLPSLRPGDECERPYPDKGSFCVALGVDVLVDDELANCESAVRMGIGAVRVPLEPVSPAQLDDALLRAGAGAGALVTIGA